LAGRLGGAPPVGTRAGVTADTAAPRATLADVEPGFLDHYLPYQLQRADQLLSTRFHRHLRQRGVALSEWRVLAVLLDGGPLTMGALTQRTLLPQPTVSHAVSRLERQGSLRRRSSGGDGRQRIVELTAEGRRVASSLVATAQRHLAETLADAGLEVTPGFIDQLRALVGRLSVTQPDR
jgi:DNA-binding MarR family transcriptional regulator